MILDKIAFQMLTSWEQKISTNELEQGMRGSVIVIYMNKMCRFCKRIIISRGIW